MRQDTCSLFSCDISGLREHPFKHCNGTGAKLIELYSRIDTKCKYPHSYSLVDKARPLLKERAPPYKPQRPPQLPNRDDKYRLPPGAQTDTDVECPQDWTLDQQVPNNRGNKTVTTKCFDYVLTSLFHFHYRPTHHACVADPKVDNGRPSPASKTARAPHYYITLWCRA